MFRVTVTAIVSYLFIMVYLTNGYAEGIYQMGHEKPQPLHSDTVLFIHVNEPQWIRIHLCQSRAENSAVYADIYTTELKQGRYSESNKLASLRSSVANTDCQSSLDAILPAMPETGKAMQFYVETAGVYAIDLRGNGRVEFERWDISLIKSPEEPVDPTDNTGNLFSYEWHFHTHSYASSKAATTKLYVMTPGGDGQTDYVWALSLQKFSGNRYTISANDIGLEPPYSGYSAPFNGEIGAVRYFAKYPVYLSYPKGADPQLRTEPLPSITDDFVFKDTRGNIAQVSPDGDLVGDTGYFSFTSDVNATFAVIIDTNRDGHYQTEDRQLIGRASKDVVNRLLWNATDIRGKVLPNGRYNVALELRLGEYHFVAKDVETSGGGEGNGLTLYKVVDETYEEATNVYWNDELLSAHEMITANTQSSFEEFGEYRHTWGSFLTQSMGNNAYVDTYTFAKAKRYYSEIIIAAKNNKPSIMSRALTIAEDSELQTEVGQVSAIDEDGDFLEYRIIRGNDEDKFDIDKETGLLRLKSKLDYEHKSQYNLTIEVTDHAQKVSKDIIIHVTNINEAPIASDDLVWISDKEKNKTISVLDNDHDPENAAIQILSVTSSEGHVTITTGNQLSYTPNTDSQAKNITIDYTISDGVMSDSAKVIVHFGEEPEDSKAGAFYIMEALIMLFILSCLRVEYRRKKLR